MFTNKKIKTMSKEINQLKNQVSILNVFKDRIEDREWIDNNPNGVLIQKSFVNGHKYNRIEVEMMYKARRMAEGIKLKTMENGINGYNILERKRIENVNGNKFELVAQYGTWKQKDEYDKGCGYDEVFYESKFLIDLQSNSGIEMSCKEITVDEFNKEIIK